MLGNSVRSFTIPKWRKIFSAIVLPILLYGAPTWFTDIKQSAPIRLLQVAQNDACPKIAGVFHTTPTHLTEKLLCIPPIRCRLCHVLRSAGARLLTLSPSHALQNPGKTRAVTLLPSFIPITPILPLCAEVSHDEPTYVSPPHPALLSHLSHPNLRLLSVPPKPTPNSTTTALKNRLSTSSIPNTAQIYILSEPPTHSALRLSTYAIFLHNCLCLSGSSHASSTTVASLLSLRTVLSRLPTASSYNIFFSDPSLMTQISLPRSRLLHIVTVIRDQLTSFFFSHPSAHFTCLRIPSPQRWSRKADTDTFAWRTPLHQEDTLLYHTHPTPSSHSRMFDEWNSSFTPKPSNPPYTPFSSDATPTLHPFITRVIGAKNRDLETACLQIITGHSFQAEYSERFRIRAHDNTTCPHCTHRYTTRHILLHCRPLESIRT